MERAERFQKLLRYIIYSTDVPIAGALKHIAGMAGISYSNLTTAYKGSEKYLTDRLMLNVNAAFGNPFNRDWLRTGSGEMFSDEKTAESLRDDNSAKIIEQQRETINRLSETVLNLSTAIKK